MKKKKARPHSEKALPSERRCKEAARWTVYMIECSDGTLYTGITNNLARRLDQHNRGRASRYTRSRRPVTLVYQELIGTRSEALIREGAIKSLSRKEKNRLL